MMKKNQCLPVLSVLALFAGTFSANAQDVTQSDIIEKLSKKTKPATRSLTRSLTKPTSEITKDDEQFLDSFGKTRGIKFMAKPTTAETNNTAPSYKSDDLSKIGDVVKKYALPTLDFKIRFEFGSAQVSGGSISQVVELAKALKHPSLIHTRIILGGHTDAKGSDAFNQSLSQKRSDSVARLIVQVGDIDPARLVPVGFGEHKLINTQDPNASENRRVEVINISTY